MGHRRTKKGPAQRRGTPEAKDLPTRVMSGWFAPVWILFLAVVVTRFWWVRNAALVWWVYGRDAYFRRGVRVLPGKPTKFSNGEFAPQWQDMVTGFSYFMIVTFGLSALLILGLKIYERWRKGTGGGKGPDSGWQVS